MQTKVAIYNRLAVKIKLLIYHKRSPEVSNERLKHIKPIQLQCVAFYETMLHSYTASAAYIGCKAVDDNIIIY